MQTRVAMMTVDDPVGDLGFGGEGMNEKKVKFRCKHEVARRLQFMLATEYAWHCF